MRSPTLLFRVLLPGLLLLLLPACGDGGETDPPVAQNPLLRPAQIAETAPERFEVEFQTTAGDFVVTVERVWAPMGADRFYTLVQAGYYDDTRVHRVVPGFMAQFGIHADPRVNQVWGRALIQDDPVVASNLRGRITFAKAGPNSRTTEVFISLEDNVRLDEDGFAPFGEVTGGIEVVDALHGGYGDGPPRGDGPYAAMARARGNEYLDEEFPELTRILQAKVIEAGAQ